MGRHRQELVVTSFQDLAGWVIGGLGAAFAGMAGLVRAGDMRTIDRIEKEQAAQANELKEQRDRVENKITGLYEHMDRKHDDLRKLILERTK